MHPLPLPPVPSLPEGLEAPDVARLQDGVFRTDIGARQKRPVDISKDGTVNIPTELLAEAMMGDRAIAEIVQDGILLNRNAGDA